MADYLSMVLVSLKVVTRTLTVIVVCDLFLREIILSNNYLVGSPPAQSTKFFDVEFNCLQGCTTLHQQICACVDVAPLASDETSALISFYNATGGPGWLVSSGWSSYPNSDPCVNLWTGVSCRGAPSTSGMPSHVTYVHRFS